MEISEIVFALILGLVGTISLISAWVVRAIMSDVKELEHTMTSCQTNMPLKYVADLFQEDPQPYPSWDFSGDI